MFIMSFYFLIWGTLQCLVSLGVKGNAVMAAAQAYESGSHACADFRPPLYTLQYPQYASLRCAAMPAPTSVRPSGPRAHLARSETDSQASAGAGPPDGWGTAAKPYSRAMSTASSSSRRSSASLLSERGWLRQLCLVLCRAFSAWMPPMPIPNPCRMQIDFSGN
jgi:hypothetical protein